MLLSQWHPCPLAIYILLQWMALLLNFFEHIWTHLTTIHCNELVFFKHWRDPLIGSASLWITPLGASRLIRHNVCILHCFNERWDTMYVWGRCFHKQNTMCVFDIADSICVLEWSIPRVQLHVPMYHISGGGLVISVPKMYCIILTYCIILKTTPDVQRKWRHQVQFILNDVGEWLWVPSGDITTAKKPEYITWKEVLKKLLLCGCESRKVSSDTANKLNVNLLLQHNTRSRVGWRDLKQ